MSDPVTTQSSESESPLLRTKVDIRQLIKDELKKCALDPVYFMKQYCYIQHMVSGRMLFNLYPYQEKAVRSLQDNKDNLFLKARQLGLSTVVACYALWLTLFHKDKNVIVIATKQDTAKNMIIKVRFAYDHLPVWLKTLCIENNKLNLRFSNGSQIKAISSSSDAGRSEAVSLLIIDEAAFIEDAETIWIAAQATLSTGGQSVLISTPNGVGNFFHQIWQKAAGKENSFITTRLTWRDHPERNNVEWYERELAIYGPRGFRQEHEAEFLGSGNTVFDVDVVQFYRETHRIAPLEKTGMGQNLWRYEYPQHDHAYLVCADVARGDGLDYSAFHVIDSMTLRQVAEFKAKISTQDFANALMTVATEYGDALLVVENNNHGWAVLQHIIDRGYKNLFYMSEDPLVIEENRHMTNKWAKRDQKKIPGFTTSHKTRPLIISKLDEYIRNKEIIIRSERTLDEMLTFIWENGKAVATENYNDDLIMSLAIGLWVRDTSLKLYQRNMELMKKTMDGITRSEQVVYRPQFLPADPYKMPIGGGATRGNPYQKTAEVDLREFLG